jgi:hypothetical protein
MRVKWIGTEPASAEHYLTAPCFESASLEHTNWINLGPSRRYCKLARDPFHLPASIPCTCMAIPIYVSCHLFIFVPQGLYLGLLSMEKGEEATIMVRSDYAFGPTVGTPTRCMFFCPSSACSKKISRCLSVCRGNIYTREHTYPRMQLSSTTYTCFDGTREICSTTGGLLCVPSRACLPTVFSVCVCVCVCVFVCVALYVCHV